MAFQVAYDTAANWASANRTPLFGEQCNETDTFRQKIGDGSTPYNSLLYADAPSGLPPWVTGKGKDRYDNIQNIYNWKGSNTRKIRTSLSRARAVNGVAHWAVYGESTATGYDGTSLKTTKSWPYVLASYISQYQGVPLGGDGIVNSSDPTGAADPRFTLGGGWGVAGWWVFNASLTNASVLTYLSSRTGANECLFFYDDAANQTNFSYTMDGGATQNVTITGTGTIKAITITGLSTSVTHTLRITSGTANIIYGVAFLNTAQGFHMHNLSRSSSGLNAGGPSGNVPGANGAWNDTTTYNSIGGQAFSMLSLSGVALDCVISMQGVNDVYDIGSPPGLYTPAQAITNLQTELTNHHGSADILLVLTPRLSVVSNAIWTDFGNRLYTLAETLDCPLIDFWDRSGDTTVMSANGEIGVDGLHPTTTWHDEVALAISQLVGA